MLLGEARQPVVITGPQPPLLKLPELNAPSIARVEAAE